jgi:hypothetical protein
MNKFITVRFAPGSAGKFCSILLQLSPDVNAWDQALSLAKGNSPATLEYFKTKFTKNFKDWQKNEPEITYQTQFVSNRFPRGDEISHEQALTNLKNDLYFNEHYNNNKRIVLISNKSRVPDWIQQHCDMVNIHIDTIHIKKWVHRARYNKLFLETDPGVFILKQEHPDYCSSHRSQLAKQFQNQHTYFGTKFSFLKHCVLNDPLTKMFTNYQNIVSDTTNATVTQHRLLLTKMLNPKECFNELQSICNRLDIGCPEQSLVMDILTYYLSIHQNC